MRRIGWLAAGLVLLACNGGEDRSLFANDGTCAPARGACAITDSFCQRMILAVTACERGDALPPLPPIREITKAQFRSELEKAAAAEMTAMMSDLWQAPLAALRLMPADKNTSSAVIDTAVEAVAAYYDPAKKLISIVKDASAGDATAATYELSHELTHYLQDRAVNLRKLIAASPASTDAHVALNALIEGEATATSTRVLTWFLHASPDRFRWPDFFDMLGQTLLDDVARSDAPLYSAVQDLPYWLGGRGVEAVLDCCGRARVNALFADPPRSLSDWGGTSSPSALGEPLDCGPPQAPSGFSLASLDSLGLAGALALLTAAGAQDFALAVDVRGDSIAVYVPDDPNGPAGVVAWRLRFALPSSASEFAAAIGSLPLRARVFDREVLITTSTDPSENPLEDPLLDACPKLEDLTPSMAGGPAGVLTSLLRR